MAAIMNLLVHGGKRCKGGNSEANDASGALPLRKAGKVFMAGEKPTGEEISRRLILEHLLWAESEGNLVRSPA